MEAKELRERLAMFRQQQEQLKHNYLLLTGAIQDCEYWLAKAEGTDSEKNPDGKPRDGHPKPVKKDRP